MSDLLDMTHINSLPQPFIVALLGGGEWPVHDIDVTTGLFRIDVCGMLEANHIGEALCFIDSFGERHESDTFYADYPRSSKDREGGDTVGVSDGS